MLNDKRSLVRILVFAEAPFPVDVLFGALGHKYAAKAHPGAVTHLEGKGFGDFKKDMVDLAVSELGPNGDEVSRLMDDHAAVDSVLRDGAERANALAEPILEEVKKTVGFLRP